VYKIHTEGSERVYMYPDVRGESETYEAWSLVCLRSGKTVWKEGVRKDRTGMRPDWKAEIDLQLSLQESGH
jgi:hypothetical protein